MCADRHRASFHILPGVDRERLLARVCQTFLPERQMIQLAVRRNDHSFALRSARSSQGTGVYNRLRPAAANVLQDRETIIRSPMMVSATHPSSGKP